MELFFFLGSQRHLIIELLDVYYNDLRSNIIIIIILKSVQIVVFLKNIFNDISIRSKYFFKKSKTFRLRLNKKLRVFFNRHLHGNSLKIVQNKSDSYTSQEI